MSNTRPYDLHDLPALTNEAGPAHRVIMNEFVPEVLSKFLAKGGDYGDAWRLLGSKGQFSDINRKFWKLYNAIWLGQPLQGEQVDQCAEDIIGHCFILLFLERYGNQLPVDAQDCDQEPDREERADDAYGATPSMPPEHHERSSEEPGRPSLQEVLLTVRRAARAESRTGTAAGRIEDALMVLFMQGELPPEQNPSLPEVMQAIKTAMLDKGIMHEVEEWEDSELERVYERVSKRVNALFIEAKVR